MKLSCWRAVAAAVAVCCCCHCFIPPACSLLLLARLIAVAPVLASSCSLPVTEPTASDSPDMVSWMPASTCVHTGNRDTASGISTDSYPAMNSLEVPAVSCCCYCCSHKRQLQAVGGANNFNPGAARLHALPLTRCWQEWQLACTATRSKLSN